MSRRPILAASLAIAAVLAIVALGRPGAGTSGTPAPSRAATVADASPATADASVPDGGGQVAPGEAIFHQAGMTFRYPASWSVHRVTEVDLGFGSTAFVLTSEPFPTDCVDPTSDLNCLEQHPLGPGSIRVEIGNVSLHGTFFDPLPLNRPANLRIDRAVVGGMPAIRTDRVDGVTAAVDEFWRIAAPDSVQRALTIDVRASEPGSAALRAAAERLIGSLVLDQHPAPVPADQAGRAAAARAAKVAAVAQAVADGGLVVMGDHATNALDDCFEAGVDRPATKPIRVTSDVLPTGTVAITCSVAAELVGGAFWKVTITGRSGAGSTVPGTAAIINEWITTAGDPAGDSWAGIVPAARAPGFLQLGAPGADAAARLAAEFDADDTDFYRCFRAGGGSAITIGPDHQPVPEIIDTTCTTDVAFAPDRHAFLVTLTAAWPAGNGHPAGTMIVHLEVGTDGSIRGPVIEGDPLP